MSQNTHFDDDYIVLLKSSLTPSNKTEFKFNEFKVNKEKLVGLCCLCKMDPSVFDIIGAKLTQQELNNITNNKPHNIFENLKFKNITPETYNPDLFNIIFKNIDLTTLKSIDTKKKTINFISLYEEITGQQPTSEIKPDLNKLRNFSKKSTSEEDTTTNEESDTSEETTPNTTTNGLKCLINLFKELGIVSKDKRTNNLNPDFINYFKNKTQENNNSIKQEINIDFNYFEPKKTNGRIIRPLKLLKLIKETTNTNLTKQDLIDDLIESGFIQESKQNKQTYYYIKKGMLEDFHEWLKNKYF